MSAVRSLDSAYADFLVSPSAHDGLTNESYVRSIIGHLTAPDRGGQYDAVKMKYEKPVRTFHQAFNACFPAKRGKRSWEHFDIETLRECGFPDLELPDAAHGSASREDEERYMAEREDAARRELGHDAPEPEYLEPVEMEYEAPPLALRTFPGPSRRERGGRDFREGGAKRAAVRVVKKVSTKRARRPERKGKKRKVSTTASVLARLIANAEKRKRRA